MLKFFYLTFILIIQKVLACRKELVEYDCQQREAVSAASQVSPVTSPRDNTTDPILKAKAVPACKPKMGKDRYLILQTRCS